MGDSFFRRVFIWPLGICLFFSVFFLCAARQFPPSELNRRPVLEDMLRKAEILRSQSSGTGVTGSLRLYLSTGQSDFSACWKNVYGVRMGYLEGWRFEIAAYELDKLIGLHMIPPTVERKFKARTGSLQLWVENALSDEKRLSDAIPIPEDKRLLWSRHKYLTRAFDCLIANDDRTQQNILYTEDWRTILIDHSRAFRSSKKYRTRLVYGRRGIKAEQLIRSLPRSFVQSIKNLNENLLQGRLSDFLTQKEIQAVLERKTLLLMEIEQMIKEEGELAVLY